MCYFSTQAPQTPLFFVTILGRRALAGDSGQSDG